MPIKMPQRPPDLADMFEKLSGKEVFLHALKRDIGPLVEGKYLHWDDLRYREPPEGLTSEAWWFFVRTSRQLAFRSLELVDKKGKPLNYAMVEVLERGLHQIDQQMAGVVASPTKVLNDNEVERERFVYRSLVEEAITSSQLEGASTTREVARDMIRNHRRPATLHELMISNNYQTMQRIVELQRQPLEPSMIFEFHRMVTDGTLEKPDAAGRLRTSDENVVVEDDYGDVLHVPPDAAELDAQLHALCEFANATDGSFVHPVIRAMAVHYQLGYLHPFIDGNGRTARALFYWSMLHHGYWLAEYISISDRILKAPKQYGRAFLLTETDGSDLTYFLLYHLQAFQEAVDTLHQHLDRKAKQVANAEANLARKFDHLNHRQRGILGHALRHPEARYTFKSHAGRQRVSHMTSRKDLLELAEAGLLSRRMAGRQTVFVVPSDLAERMRNQRA